MHTWSKSGPGIALIAAIVGFGGRPAEAASSAHEDFFLLLILVIGFRVGRRPLVDPL